jgi:hypothetical protein
VAAGAALAGVVIRLPFDRMLRRSAHYTRMNAERSNTASVVAEADAHS